MDTQKTGMHRSGNEMFNRPRHLTFWMICVLGAFVILNLGIGLVRPPVDQEYLENLIQRDKYHRPLSTPILTPFCNYIVGACGSLHELGDDGCEYRTIVLRLFQILPTMTFGPKLIAGEPPPSSSVMQLEFDRPLLEYWPMATGLSGPDGLFLQIGLNGKSRSDHNACIIGDAKRLLYFVPVRLLQNGKIFDASSIKGICIQRPLDKQGRLFQVIASSK